MSATVPAGHQGSVSKKKTGYQLPVAEYQLPVADYLTSFKGPLGASPGGIADFLSSFKGPHGARAGIPRMACMKIFDSFFACFPMLHFFIFFVPKHTPEGGPKSDKNHKNP